MVRAYSWDEAAPAADLSPEDLAARVHRHASKGPWADGQLDAQIAASLLQNGTSLCTLQHAL